MKKNIERTGKTTVMIVRKLYKSVTRTLLAYPGRSFFGIIGFFFLIILTGSLIGHRKPVQRQAETAPKQVTLFSIGRAPKVRMMGSVETNGAVKVVAQSGGIVQQVYVQPGSLIGKGATLAWLSTNYQGGTVPTISRQIAQKNLDFVEGNIEAQKAVIARQRQLADQQKNQAADLRAITDQSLADTKNLIALDQDIVDTLSQQRTQYEATNSAGVNNALILQTKQAIAGIQGGLNALRTSLANAQYQSGGDNAPAQMAGTQHDIAVAQLDLQEKSLELNKELAGLNLRMAQISESLMYPSSPVAGTVERVYVMPGQSVNPGTVIATITGSAHASRIIVLVSGTTARNISRIEPSTVITGGKEFPVYPSYVSSQPTDGALYSVLFAVPEDMERNIANGESVAVDLAIGAAMANGAVPFVPLDAVYQTQQESYVFVATQSAQGLEAVSRQIELGSVFGEFVEARRGLSAENQVIVTRSVVDGDMVVSQ